MATSSSTVTPRKLHHRAPSSQPYVSRLFEDQHFISIAIYLVPGYCSHQLVAMATGSRYPFLQDGKHLMPRGKLHSTGTVLPFSRAQSSTSGDELAWLSADGVGGRFTSKCVLILKFILVVVILFWFTKPSKWFGYQLPTITPQIGLKCSKL